MVQVIKSITLIIATALCLLAQTPTSIRPEQLRSAAPEAPRPTLLAITLRGFTSVTLGPGISVTQSPNGYTIDAAPAQSPKFNIVLIQSTLPRAADGTYPAAPNSIIHRNGLRMELGSDYAVSNGRILFAASAGVTADDKITADEFRIEAP